MVVGAAAAGTTHPLTDTPAVKGGGKGWIYRVPTVLGRQAVDGMRALKHARGGGVRGNTTAASTPALNGVELESRSPVQSDMLMCQQAGRIAAGYAASASKRPHATV